VKDSDKQSEIEYGRWNWGIYVYMEIFFKTPSIYFLGIFADV